MGDKKKAKQFLIAAYWNSIRDSKSAAQEENDGSEVEDKSKIVKENQSYWYLANARYNESNVIFILTPGRVHKSD